MCELITREEAYSKIIKLHISTMTETAMIERCLKWVGIKKNDYGYQELFNKMMDIFFDGNIEGIETLLDLFTSAKLYDLMKNTNRELEELLNNHYKVTEGVEQVVESNIKGRCFVWD